MLTLLFALSAVALGCGDNKTSDPKSKSNTDLKPLPAPGSPGGEAPKGAAKPGGNNSAQ